MACSIKLGVRALIKNPSRILCPAWGSYIIAHIDTLASIRMNHVASAVGISILLYLGYIAVAPTPIDTLDRTCTAYLPVAQEFLASGARIFSPSAEATINEAF